MVIFSAEYSWPGGVGVQHHLEHRLPHHSSLVNGLVSIPKRFFTGCGIAMEEGIEAYMISNRLSNFQNYQNGALSSWPTDVGRGRRICRGTVFRIRNISYGSGSANFYLPETNIISLRNCC